MPLSIGEAFEKMKVGEISGIISQELADNRNPYELLKECQAAMERIGTRFETGEYFMAELILSAKMFERATELLLPKLTESGDYIEDNVGKIVLGTPKGDIHDLGKNIFSLVAQAAGFKVIDLGVDVPVERFAEAVAHEKPEIVGMSALLTTTFPSMEKIVDLLVERGLRGTVKIVIGGGATGKETQRLVGADAYTLDATKGVRICRELIES